MMGMSIQLLFMRMNLLINYFFEMVNDLVMELIVVRFVRLMGVVVI